MPPHSEALHRGRSAGSSLFKNLPPGGSNPLRNAGRHLHVAPAPAPAHRELSLRSAVTPWPRGSAALSRGAMGGPQEFGQQVRKLASDDQVKAARTAIETARKESAVASSEAARDGKRWDSARVRRRRSLQERLMEVVPRCARFVRCSTRTSTPCWTKPDRDHQSWIPWSPPTSPLLASSRSRSGSRGWDTVTNHRLRGHDGHRRPLLRPAGDRAPGR